MSYRTVQGYVMVVVSGLVLLAAIVLIVLQWGNPAEFSLYGKNFSIRTIQGGKVGGGVNTALLMLFSAVGGVALWWTLKFGFRGIRSVRRGRRDDEARSASRRIEKLEKGGGEKTT